MSHRRLRSWWHHTACFLSRATLGWEMRTAFHFLALRARSSLSLVFPNLPESVNSRAGLAVFAPIPGSPVRREGPRPMPSLSVSCELWSSSHVPVLPLHPASSHSSNKAPPLSLGVGGVFGLLASSGWGLPWTLFCETDSALGGNLLDERVPAPPGSASFPADDKNNLWSYTWAI